MRCQKIGVSVFLLLLFACMLSMSAWAANEEIVVIYTNDVHSYIDNHMDEENPDGLTYSKVAALKSSFSEAVLVDAGDHIQGTAYGGMDQGATIIRLMNAAGYDLATLGNHEFDYGMSGCFAAIDAAEYPYVSCNFHQEADGVMGESVLESYVILERAGKRLAFIGITTPETLTSTTPAYFQDEAGNYIYGIAGGSDGAELYQSVQTAIDMAKSEGADYLIAVGHLGVDASSSPWTSREVIANTVGLDALIDGHSHTTIQEELVADKEGNSVVLTQTGSYLNAVGTLVISPDGEISTRLLSGEDLADLTPDAEVKTLEDAWISEIDASLGEVIAYLDVTLDNFDAEGNRLVRRQSTNSGDFAADALYYFFDEMGMDVDVAVMNGGGIRNTALTGEVSYLHCKEIHTFGNVACLLRVTGQQLLDALEWSVSELAADQMVESGSFLHAAGMKYSIDLRIPTTVQMDDKGIWTGGPTGEYRVQNVQIKNRETGEYEPLDLTAEYHLAGYNYTLRDLGDGFAMFRDAVNVLDYAGEDYMILANYLQSFPVSEETGLPTVTEADGYGNVGGSGRIQVITADTVLSEEEASEQEDSESVLEEAEYYEVQAGDSLWKIAEKLYLDGTLWTKLYQVNREELVSANLIFIGQHLRLPQISA